MGNTGTDGPVCEGYARAFKVLCDNLHIPCVLVDGNAGGPHMWNYAQVDGEWYAVDVTWNDPTGGDKGAVSGYENTDWLLVGSETVVENQTFLASHPVSNTASTNGGVSFTNGPILNSERYVFKPTPQVTFPSSSQTVTYTGQEAEVIAPSITLETENDGMLTLEVTPSYSYQRSGTTGFTDGLPKDAGTYTIRAEIPATNEYNTAYGTMTLTIQKSTPALSVVDSYNCSKTYDGRPYEEPDASQAVVTGAAYGNVKFVWYRNTVSNSNRLNSAPSDAGTYILVSSVDETDNTRAISVNTNITINRRPIEIMANSAHKSYGDPDPELTYSLVSGTLANGDSLKGSLSRESGEDVSAGSYRILQGSLTDENNPNYKISFQSGTFTIEKSQNIPAPEAARITDCEVELKPVNLGSGGGTVEYGFAEINNIDQVSWQTSPRFSDLMPGTTYRFFIRVSDSTNYDDSWRSRDITTLKTIVAVPTAEKRYVYTGSLITVDITGYDSELMAMTGTVSETNAGDYTVQFQLLDTTHYAWKDQPDNTASVTVAWTIEKADQAELILEPVESKTYGDAVFELKTSGGTGDGQIHFTVPDGSEVLSISGNQAAIIGAGTVRVTAVKAGNANYNDGTPTVIDVTVAKKPVTVKAADKTRLVNRDNPELTLETPTNGVLVGDDKIDALGVTLSTTAQKNSPVGTYEITGTASSNSNYQVTVRPGTLTISRSGSGGGSGSSGGSGGGSGSSGSGSSSGSGGSSKKEPSTSSIPSPGTSTGGSWSSEGSRWRFLNSAGSYVSGRIETDSQGNTQEFIAWQLINNVWWAFGADSYAKDGWILDASSNLWYNIDINTGMKTNWYQDGSDSNWYFLDPSNGHMLTDWQMVNGVWYYLNPVSQVGRPLGAMYHNERTPDGYFVGEDGSWTGQ